MEERRFAVIFYRASAKYPFRLKLQALYRQDVVLADT
jgi:hypothetical protein